MVIENKYPLFLRRKHIVLHFIIIYIFPYFFNRRREWDLSSEAESAADLVRDLQKENSELCNKERRRVQDDREKEGDLDLELNSKFVNGNSEVILM